MDHLPSIPEDVQEINKLLDKFSYSDLYLLNNMDEDSRKYFFDEAKRAFDDSEKQSSFERIRALKFFFIVVGICALTAVFLLNKPHSELSALIWLFASLSFVSIIGNFIAIP